MLNQGQGGKINPSDVARNPGRRGRGVCAINRRRYGGFTGRFGWENSPEFTSKRLDQWAYLNGVELDFSRPGKPTDNAFIEAFNGRFRQRELVPVPAGRRGESGNLAKTLQWGKAQQRVGEPVPEGVRRTGGNSGLTRKTSTMAGTGNGASPVMVRLT